MPGEVAAMIGGPRLHVLLTLVKSRSLHTHTHIHTHITHIHTHTGMAGERPEVYTQVHGRQSNPYIDEMVGEEKAEEDR